MNNSSTAVSRVFGPLFKALAIAAAFCATTAAQAGVLRFDAAAEAQYTQTSDFVDGDYWYMTSEPNAGLPIGAIATSARCIVAKCPANNASKYFAGLNDGYLMFGLNDASEFKLKSLDASFLGTGNSGFPATGALLNVVGFNAQGRVASAALWLSALATPQFVTFDLGAFANYALTDVAILSYACDAAGNCQRSGAMSNFAIDNIVTASVVPEPGSFALMGLGLLGLGAAARRRAV